MMLFCFARMLDWWKGNEQHIPSQAIQWLCLFRNMLLVSMFRHLDRDNVAKRSTQRWRSLMVLLETSNIFRSELIRWLGLLWNMLLVSAFQHLGRDNVAKCSTTRWRSLVGLLEMSYMFLLKLYSGCACLKNIGKGVAICLEISYNTFSAWDISTFNFLKSYIRRKLKKD